MCITSTGTLVPYGITQCYLHPGRGDIYAFLCIVLACLFMAMKCCKL